MKRGETKYHGLPHNDPYKKLAQAVIADAIYLATGCKEYEVFLYEDDRQEQREALFFLLKQDDERVEMWFALAGMDLQAFRRVWRRAVREDVKMLTLLEEVEKVGAPRVRSTKTLDNDQGVVVELAGEILSGS